MSNLLITGGAGFVGAHLALAFKRAWPKARIATLDNLRRRGSEKNVQRLESAGVEFHHGDVRVPSDLEATGGDFDWLIDASAEPSVLAGVDGSPAYVIETNLNGTLNCLELCRRKGYGLLFISTSRVYSIDPLREIPLRETETRFEPDPEHLPQGVSQSGISESFPTWLPRSYYGASKLASEMLIQEYASSEGLRAIVDRCGTIAGPGQFGHAEQGVFTHWLASHHFGLPLTYTGFGGTGKQVRDLLHPDDLFELVAEQITRGEEHSGSVFNVGGGLGSSTSLLEFTRLSRELTGNEVPVGSRTETGPVDIPYYVSDCSRVQTEFGWQPRRSVETIASETLDWLRQRESELAPLFRRK